MRGSYRRSLSFAVGLGFSTTCLVACALIADLPDYNARPGSSSGSSSSGSTSSSGGDGSIEGSSLIEGGPGPDAPPSVTYLGCSAAPDVMQLAYWKLDEGTGRGATDCTGNNRNGTHQGTTGWIAGKIGPFALNLNGLGSVDFGNPPDVFDREGAMTVAAWVNVQSFTTSGRIVSKGGGPSDRGWELNVEMNSTITFRIAIDNMTQVETVSAMPEQVWTHVAGVFDPSVAVRLYINGRLAQENTANVPALQRKTTFPMWMGNRPGDSCCGFVGQIDDLHFFAKALPEKDIAALAAQ